MSDFIYKEESFGTIGISDEVYNNLGPGFPKIVNKDKIIHAKNSVINENSDNNCIFENLLK